MLGVPAGCPSPGRDPPALPAGNSRQGLRCKACKAGVHLWCSQGVSLQQCPGKTVRAGGGGGSTHTGTHRQSPPPTRTLTPTPALSLGRGCGHRGAPLPQGHPSDTHTHPEVLGVLGVPFPQTPPFRPPQATSFRRNFSSPLLLPEQGGPGQDEPPPGEAPPHPGYTTEPPTLSLRFGGDPGTSCPHPHPTDPNMKVDPVYEALRFGTSLAQGTSPPELPPSIQVPPGTGEG